MKRKVLSYDTNNFFSKKVSKNSQNSSKIILVECPICSMKISESLVNLHIDSCIARKEKLELEKDKLNLDRSDLIPCSNVLESSSQLHGLYFIKDFISEVEADSIIAKIDSHVTLWHNSKFNGFYMYKSYGYKTQFGVPGEERLVRVNKKDKGELDIPEFLLDLVNKFSDIMRSTPDCPKLLKSFTPNECNVNNYIRDIGHFLLPHYDDRALSGPILMNLSLGCDAIMTFNSEHNEEIDVLLPKNCLQLVTGNARYNFKHSIRSTNIFGPRRVSVTWRQAGLGKSGTSKVVGENRTIA